MQRNRVIRVLAEHATVDALGLRETPRLKLRKPGFDLGLELVVRVRFGFGRSSVAHDFNPALRETPGASRDLCPPLRRHRSIRADAGVR